MYIFGNSSIHQDRLLSRVFFTGVL